MRLEHTIRAYLRSSQYQDGLTILQLIVLTGKPDQHVRRTLKHMPDAYIDRWVVSRAVNGQKKKYAAVWCVVTPPTDCPHPTETQGETNVHG